MKLSLRNIMLAAAVVAVAAPAIAAETVTVKTDWYKTYTTDRNHSRFGAGFGGKVYFKQSKTSYN